MAVSGHKRKAIGDPCTVHLETSGSTAATAFADLQGFQKRRHTNQGLHDNLTSAHEQQSNAQAQIFLSPPHGMVGYGMETPLHRSSSRNEGSSLSGYGTAFDVGGSPQISTATARSRGWSSEYAPAGSFVSSDSHPQSSVSDQHEVAMHAETPHSQAQEGRGAFSFQPQGLQRSNSEPNMRLMLASPLSSMPQLVFQPALPAFGSSTTAGALVPYKAPEGSMLF
ncbi:hypothetical protein CVIRNUC_002083 [Coccomyxa viridis]|uniref:Uncharacterized protein n=1 Tax=Coccomyxa viridis TaxID=1274662 RepID=A0AAV1HWP4_9CHLO|nr:hypothetical protein CVIRNUC_002083 [Coccomyxa viridis]